MSGSEVELVLVSGLVDATVLLGELPGEVGVEVAVADQGPEFEHGFGAGQGPAGTCDVEAVFDQVAAGALDDAGGVPGQGMGR